MRWIKRIVFLLLLVGLVGVCAAWYMGRKPVDEVSFRMAEVARGDVVLAISSTGTVEPEELIDIGAQVAGQIITFGKDTNGKPIDYGSIVEEGMVLAQIDDSIYLADITTANAQLAQANAGVKRAEAELAQSQARLTQAERDWERAKKLGPSDALAQASYDAYEATYLQAKANIALSDAAIIQAKASVEQAAASLKRAERNLGYTTIKSPVRGVIIDRRVNIGQTVVASLNAPSLFLIAKDLRRMQVWVAVNEADIGNVFPGQRVTFTVDAFEGQVFTGEVNKVRLNATMTQNIVTYTVEVNTDNSSGRLIPYVTANVKFEVKRRDDVLMVPNTALRWSPEPEQIAPDARAAVEQQQASSGRGMSDRGEGGRGPSTRSTTRPTSRRSGGGSEARRGTLWVKDGEFVRPVYVRVGISDGLNTEISGGDELVEGLQVIAGEVRTVQGPTASGGTNPFAPPSFRRGSSSGSSSGGGPGGGGPGGGGPGGGRGAGGPRGGGGPGGGG